MGEIYKLQENGVVYQHPQEERHDRSQGAGGDKFTSEAAITTHGVGHRIRSRCDWRRKHNNPHEPLGGRKRQQQRDAQHDCRQHIRNAGLSLVLCAGLGMGVAAMANLAYAAETADKAAATETVAAASTDGEYTAEGKGIGGKVPVTVEVKDGKVATVTVGGNSETQGIGSKAIEQLPAKIVEAGGTEGVDAVSGATVTSKAIFSAVDEILDQAKA